MQLIDIPNLIMNAVQSTIPFSRQLLAGDFDGKNRDLNAECGYPGWGQITIEDLSRMYEREGVARRIVNVLPDECWTMDPIVYENNKSEDTEFEKSWKEVKEKYNVFHYLNRIDRVSGVGQFGILVLGFDDKKKLSEPAGGFDQQTGKVDENYKEEHDLLFIKPVMQPHVRVKSYEKDSSSPRFGKPLLYQVRFTSAHELPLAGADQPGAPSQSANSTEAVGQYLDVHWSRCIHVADNVEMSEIFGIPRMVPVYNRLFDLRKLLGGSAEMFWKGAFPGIAFETNPDIVNPNLDVTSLREEFQKYQDGIQRFLALSGISAKSLAPQVADPRGHIDAQMSAIATTIGVPLRVLLGSEAGELASSQDKQTWNGRLKHRQNKHVTPSIVVPFIQALQAMNVLPRTETTVKVEWPDLDLPTRMDKAEVLLRKTESMARYVQGNVDVLIEPKDFLVQFMELDEEVVDSMLANAASFDGLELPDMVSPGTGPRKPGEIPEPQTTTTKLPQGTAAKAMPGQQKPKTSS
jgi:hypothetical protein